MQIIQPVLGPIKQLSGPSLFQNIQREEKDMYVLYYNRASSLTFMCLPYHIYDLYKSTYKYNVAITSKGTIMEIRSTRSFNAIPATIIRGVFNL